jgi:hypothetical protein
MENVSEGVPFYELHIRSGCAKAFEEFKPSAPLSLILVPSPRKWV